MAWVLCSKQDIQDFANIPQNALPDSWSEVVEGLIRQRVGSPYVGKTQTTTETFTGTGDGIITLERPPVASVTSITINGNVYIDEYTLLADTIVLPVANYGLGDSATVVYESLGISVYEEQSIYEPTWVISVRKGPIISVTSLVLDDITLTDADYYVDHNNIFLRTYQAQAGNLNAKITYISGRSEIDEPYRMAAIAMIIAIYNYKQRGGSDASMVWSTDPKEMHGEMSASKNFGLLDHLNYIMMSTVRRNKLRINL